MNKPVSFEIAKMLKEKGFDEWCHHFYTKPNSKMFGIDEHFRYYYIKNTPKKLYKTGEYAALHVKNVYSAPTIAEVVMWLYEKHGIWISVVEYPSGRFCWITEKLKGELIFRKNNHGSPTEAYEVAIEYALEIIEKADQ